MIDWAMTLVIEVAMSRLLFKQNVSDHSLTIRPHLTLHSCYKSTDERLISRCGVISRWGMTEKQQIWADSNLIE